MALPITVPYTFGNATTAIPLSNLDSDYATVYQAVNGIGNGSVALANVAITGGTISGNTTASNVTVSSGTFTNVTLSNVTISSVSTPITAAEGGTGLTSFTANGVVYASSTSALATGSALTFNGTNFVVGYTSAGNIIAYTGGSIKVNRADNATNNEIKYVTSGDLFYFNQANGGAYQFNISGSEQMRLTSTGLGIGNTSPGAIFGSTIVAGPSGGSGTLAVPAGYIYSNTTNDLKYAAGTTASGAHIFNSAYSAAEYARIDSSGNLLVGQTSAGALNSNSICINGPSSGGSVVVNHANGSSSGSGYEFFAYNASVIGSITQSGTTAVLYNTTSDQRLKENIVDAPQGNIDGIKVRSFDWIADGSHQDYGMIAQELYDVAPYAVTGTPDSEEMMQVDYSKLVPMMIKEIQSLKQRIATLENK